MSHSGLLDPFFAEIASMGERDALAAVERCRRRCDAVEARILAARVDPSTGDTRGASRLLRAAGGASKGERGRRLRRAEIVAELPQVADQLESGETSGEVIDLLAAANRQSEGAAIHDADFVERLVAAGPDLGRRVKARWVDDRAKKADVEAEYRRQHQQRTAWRHRTEAGLDAITVAGDTATIDQMWWRIQSGADAAYRGDGGRETTRARHPRSHQQRVFDAAAELLGGQSVGSKGSAGSRPAVVVTIDVDRLFGPGTDDAPVAHQVGTGPVADQVVIDALQSADLYTLLCSPQGEPLWCGRARPHASKAQLVALIVRDQGCIATGEHWQKCDAHHCVPKGSPARGPTDIDNLALLWQEMHRETHRQDLLWERDAATQTWSSRLAPPHQRAPSRKQQPQRE